MKHSMMIDVKYPTTPNTNKPVIPRHLKWGNRISSS